jgi:hypothetical protein
MVNKSGDPIAFWQQMVGEMQKSFTAFTRLRPMGTTSHPSSDDSATGSGTGQKPMADLMENYFAGMNVPSRGQLTALNDRLASIESELAETRALLKELLAAKAPAVAPQLAADVGPQLNEIKGLLDTLVAASKVQPRAPVDLTPELNEIKALLDGLVAASKAPPAPTAPAVDVTPQLGEIRGLLDKLLNATRPSDTAPLEAELREIRTALDTLLKVSQPGEGEPTATEVVPRASERPGKSRNKKHGGAPAGPGARPGNDVPSGS